MSIISEAAVSASLQQFESPYFSGYTIKSIEQQSNVVDIIIMLGYPLSKSKLTNLKAELQSHLAGDFAELTIIVSICFRVSRHQVQNQLKPKLGIRNIIAVGSGKGGVGKSTVSVNLALALHQMGVKVGLLDADIYGPSQTLMLGTTAQPQLQDKKFIPLEAHGIHMMSMGSLVENNLPMIWRGPMVSGALLQLLNDTHWPELDYLIVDLPPGTGDIQLTMAQKLPISGAVVVTTPQDIALLDAKRAITMFNKVSIPVLGVVENMSQHICTQCGHIEAIFGEGGGKKITEEFKVPFLGVLPLVASIGHDVENGTPTVIKAPEGEITQGFIKIAENTVVNLAKRPKDYSVAMPMKTLQPQD